MTIRIGIIGGSGYTGAELVRLVAMHPEIELTHIAAKRAAGERLVESWPGLTGLAGLTDFTISAYDPSTLREHCDVVFLALPHGVAAQTVPELLDANLTVIDLGADFRIKDPASYERYYKLEHASPNLLPQAVYGLVELNRESLKGAKLIANPGCYPTAVTLAAYPLVEAGLSEGWITADCLSGVSGAGRNPSRRNLFSEVAENARPYGIAGTHRHVPEIEQNLGINVTFTPHLVPMVRGMVATVHVRLGQGTSYDEIRALYAARYENEPMIVLRDDVPSTADVRGTNRAHLHVAWDEERHVATIVSVIDNLMKGASGQAVQSMNVALGLDETLGLPMHPLLP